MENKKTITIIVISVLILVLLSMLLVPKLLNKEKESNKAEPVTTTRIKTEAPEEEVMTMEKQQEQQNLVTELLKDFELEGHELVIMTKSMNVSRVEQINSETGEITAVFEVNTATNEIIMTE